MRGSASELAPPIYLESEAVSRRFWGWILGWALTGGSVVATGGTAGWRQSPAWSEVLGLTLGAAGMFAGAWWSRENRRGAAAWAGAFLFAVWLLELGALGETTFALAFAAGLAGLLGASLGNLLDRRPFRPELVLRWSVGFAIGGFVAIVPGLYLSHFVGLLAERLTGLQAADTAGVVLGAALSGGLGGSMAVVMAAGADRFD